MGQKYTLLRMAFVKKFHYIEETIHNWSSIGYLLSQITSL